MDISHQNFLTFFLILEHFSILNICPIFENFDILFQLMTGFHFLDFIFLLLSRIIFGNVEHIFRFSDLTDLYFYFWIFFQIFKILRTRLIVFFDFFQKVQSLFHLNIFCDWLFAGFQECLSILEFLFYL